LTQIVVNPRWPAAQKADWCAKGAFQFVLRATAALKGKPPANGRVRPLLALPVVGTGAGGGWHEAGEIVRELVRTLTAVVREVDVDVALVTHTGDQLAAVQQQRRLLAGSGSDGDPWHLLPDHLKRVGRELAAHSIQGRLVLFLGAGVSVGAGLPTWAELLDRLAEGASLDVIDREALKQLPAVDQARIIRDRLERASAPTTSAGVADASAVESTDSSAPKANPLAAAIREHTKADYYGLTHALLANLSVAESVTTNYDTLFEEASEAAGYETAALPYASVEGAHRWLLKMHGCVNHPEDIVLTREDFLRYADRRGALAGIVQALLITRHMLFVGFSLTDDNFLRIADEVRKVVRLPPPGDGAENHKPFGTALLLKHSHLLPRLWEGDITCVSMTAPNAASDATGLTETEAAAATSEAAHQFEVLLDFVLAEASQNISHLLDARYDDLLTDDERELRNLLAAFQNAPESVKSLPAWQPIAAMLRSLGADTYR